MYWWNIKALANELKAKKVPQLEKFKYFFAVSILTSVFFELAILVPVLEETAMLDVIGSLIYLLIVALGIIVCYKANKKGDNKEFIDRFICLSWPIGVRLAIIFIVVLILYFILGYNLFGDAFDSFMQKTTIIGVLFEVGFTTTFYLWGLFNQERT